MQAEASTCFNLHHLNGERAALLALLRPLQPQASPFSTQVTRHLRWCRLRRAHPCLQTPP